MDDRKINLTEYLGSGGNTFVMRYRVRGQDPVTTIMEWIDEVEPSPEIDEEPLDETFHEVPD